MTKWYNSECAPFEEKKEKNGLFPPFEEKKEKNGYRLLLIVLYAFPKGMSKFPNLSDFQLLK